VIEIDEGVPGPETIPKFLAGDDFTGLLEKNNQNLKWLLGKFESDTVLAELAGFQIQFKNAELQNSGDGCGATHGLVSEYIARRKQGQSGEPPVSLLFSIARLER
jgi:hypothetical protein